MRVYHLNLILLGLMILLFTGILLFILDNTHIDKHLVYDYLQFWQTYVKIRSRILYKRMMVAYVRIQKKNEMYIRKVKKIIKKIIKKIRHET